MVIFLDENKKIAYFQRMEFLNNNQTGMDCLIVAIYNTIIASGRKPVPYKTIKKFAKRKRWYSDSNGFLMQYFDDILDKYKVRCIPVRPHTREIYDRVITGRSIFLFSVPRYGKTGHGMLAVKGQKGVKVINNVVAPHGWKTLCKDVKQGYFTLLAFEIEASK